MNDKETVTTTMWIMLVLQTIGSVDMPGKGERKLPSPRSFVAIIITWTILELVASFGSGAARLASRASVVLVLVGGVLGPFGQTLVSFLNGVASGFAIQPSTNNTTTSTQPNSQTTIV